PPGTMHRPPDPRRRSPAVTCLLRPADSTVEVQPAALVGAGAAVESPETLVDVVGQHQQIGFRRARMERPEFGFDPFTGDMPGPQPILAVVVPAQFVTDLVDPAVHEESVLGAAGTFGPFTTE